ncbi:MAG TPA: hypothetical protein VG501_05560 [Rhizomicrobium sp.]|nr:hypothetical protein [Rhizomicrobium sp.]
MRTKSRPMLKKAGAMLCIALTLVFTQAAVASAVDEVEHLFVGHHPHHHMLFSDLTLDFGHHHSGDADEADHHHHPGDLGSSSFLVATAPDAVPEHAGVADVPPKERHLAKIRLALPERPPRTGHIRL